MHFWVFLLGAYVIVTSSKYFMLVSSVLSDCLPVPRTVAHQFPLSLEFSRQGEWSVLPFSTPGDLPNPRIQLSSLASSELAGGFFTMEPPGKPWNKVHQEGNTHSTLRQSNSRITYSNAEIRGKRKPIRGGNI